MRQLLFLTVLTGCAAFAGAPAGTPPATSSYVPDKFAAAAYARAKAAGADVLLNPHENDPTAIAAGQQIYATRCSTCHGLSGKGDGPASVAFDPRPTDSTDPSPWAFSTAGTRHWIVQNGVKGTGMASVGLTDDEAWQVLAYVKHTFQP